MMKKLKIKNLNGGKMINRKKPVLKPAKKMWKPKSKVWFLKNEDRRLARSRYFRNKYILRNLNIN